MPMYIYKAQNAAASKITVTSTATKLFDLINTAGGTDLPNAGYPSQANAIDLVVESGSDVRVLFDGNTPTATNGVLLSQGVMYKFRGVPLDKMMLIRTGSANATCSIQVGVSDDNESGGGIAYAATTEQGSAGGSSAGGGNDTYYAKPSGLNADAVSAYASATSLTVTGLPFTFTEYDIAKIEQIDSSGNVTVFTSKGDFSVSGNTITVSGASFSSSDEFVVTLSGPPRTENTAISAEQVAVLNPDSQNFSSNYESASSQGDGTTNYYYDLNGWKNGFSIQIEDTPGATGTNTYKVYASNQDDGTEDSSKTYQDITQYGMDNLTGAAAASYTSSVFLKNVEGFMPVTIKVEVVRSGDGGSTDGAWDIFFKKY